MSRPLRPSILLWQTGLFAVVIVVATLVLSGSLSAGLRAALAEIGGAEELRNASAVARRLEAAFPLGPDSRQKIRDALIEYRSIYGGGIWVFDHNGVLLVSSHDEKPSEIVLERARDAGLAAGGEYTHMDLREGGWVVASRAVLGPLAASEGVVVTASPVDDALGILNSVRTRLWITFWVSLAIAGLVGLGFSTFISRRIRAMSVAATAIADGDFRQRLPTGLVPDEVRDLADTYNMMAAELGEAFATIEDNRREIAAVIESMAEGVVAFDANGIVRVVNPKAVHLLETGGRDLIGVPAAEAIAGRDVHAVITEGLTGHSAVATANVGDRMVLLHATPLLEADGTVDGAVLLLVDVTEQHRIEDAQRRFIADASHEMRTPIAAIKGMLELLEDGAKEVPEVRDDFIHTMQVEADRLGRLVTDLLTLAQLDAGSLALKPSEEFAADLLGDVARIMHALAEGAEVTLVVDLAEPDLKVTGDRDKIVQVLLSFTDNALKHSPAGSSVHLRARRNGEAVRLEVADEGSGIEPEQVSRVFERFYRADAARSGGGGAGLGLAIAKEIVEAHGSQIEVTSAPGRGTTFGFDLPEA